MNPDKKEKVKARRWTIYDGHTGFPKLVGPAVAYAENVQVIEKSAHDRALHWAEKLAGAMQKSISRSDDYGDSHCSQPIRETLAEFRAEFGKGDK